MSNQIETTGADNLAVPKHHIFLPSGVWAPVKFPLLTYFDDDVHCDPAHLIVEPLYETLWARVHNSIVEAGLCSKSGSARYRYIDNHFNHRIKGDIFDQNEIFFDREKIYRDKDRKEITFCSYFGRQERKTMFRIRDRAHTARTKTLDSGLEERMFRYTVALKVALACIGYPEFCKRSTPEGYIRLVEEYANKPKNG